jgi:hypothetical protein
MDGYEHITQATDVTVWLAIAQGDLALLANILYDAPLKHHAANNAGCGIEDQFAEEMEDNHGVY